MTGLCLILEPGTFTAVVGPSGAGKTTLLAIAAGSDTGFSGRLERAPAAVRTAVGFQEPRLLPWLSVERNVAFGLELAGCPRRQARQRARETLATVGLSHVTTARPWTLSGGMRQRVSLARALVVDPELLLLDEPLAALDEGNSARLRDVLARSCPPGRRTVLYVTHSLTDASLLADRVLVLGSGRLVADVPVELTRPRQAGHPCAQQVRARLSNVMSELVPQPSEAGP
ncbi:MAG: ATP-binding cassette domain-containing protein [Dermatophilaceae bacterium]